MNPCVKKCVITGAMRINEENLFSGLNQFEEYTVFNDYRYCQYYGFQEAQLNSLIERLELVGLDKSNPN